MGNLNTVFYAENRPDGLVQERIAFTAMNAAAVPFAKSAMETINIAKVMNQLNLDSRTTWQEGA